MKNIKYIVLLSVIFSLPGCSGFLEKAPKLSQSTEITLSDYTGLNKAVAGAYSPLQSTSWYGASFILDAEMRSGNGRREADGKFQSNRYVGAYTWNYSADNTSGLWSFAYYVISAANNVLNNLEGKTGKDVSQQDLDNLKAEALFLRALSHFDLVLIFAQPYTYKPESLGVPVVLKTDPEGKPARNTVAQVYDQVVQDLLEAEKVIDPAYARKDIVDSKASASLYAIQALLSRVYLYMGKWQEAANYATKVINSPKFALWTANEYPNVWGKNVADATGEVIFEIYGKKTNGYYGSWEDISYMTSPEGYADCGVSKDVTGLFEAKDVRGTLFRTDKENESGGLLWTKKYLGKGDGTPDANNIIVLRLSEMYLNRAEAIMNGAVIPGGVTAVGDINAIRSKRGLDPVSSVGREAIELERRLELVYEGHYFFDLARWNKPVVRVDFTNTKNKNVDFPSDIWALPIAQREIDVNENLQQNPGY